MEFHLLTMKNLLRTFLCFGCLLASCTQTVTTPDIPFVEQLVVSCFLYGDSSVFAVNVSKTLPVNVTYDRDAALIRNATVWLQTPTERLRASFDSVRKQYLAPVGSWVVGGTYTLSVEWNGRKLEGSTFMPDVPVVDSLTEEGAFFRPDAAVAYAAADERYGIPKPDTGKVPIRPVFIRGLPWFRNLMSGKQTDSGVVMRTYDFSLLLLNDSVVFLSTKFHAVDGRYYDFFRSLENTGGVSIFGSFGINPEYTMRGDGIGVIAAVSRTTPWWVLKVVRK
ncbi:MAG: hypothetical protein ACKO9V_06315 [Candidatus Kapaibacterium sp.]